MARRHETEEERRWLAQARAERLNAVQAAARFPRSKFWFLRRGVRGPLGAQPKIDPAQARALRAEGLTWAVVAERLGCSPRGASTAARR